MCVESPKQEPSCRIEYWGVGFMYFIFVMESMPQNYDSAIKRIG